MIDGKITDKIYHGCARRYANGEIKLINFKKGGKMHLCYRKSILERTKHLLLNADKGINKK